MGYKVFWTEEAVRNLGEIIDYLYSEWTEKEVVNFKAKLSVKIDLISKNPKMFPVSGFQPRLRKAVLSKQTSIFYEFKNDTIYLAYIFVNFRSHERLK
jgi:plasmid stabilization system protein ParE